MKANDGNKTKKITLVFPESAEVVDITYYWMTSRGDCIKTMTALIGRDALKDGAEFNCVTFPDEKESESRWMIKTAHSKGKKE